MNTNKLQHNFAKSSHGVCVHLLRGGNDPLEFTQEDLSTDYRLEFLDALGDLLRRELLYALNKNFFDSESDIL